MARPPLVPLVLLTPLLLAGAGASPARADEKEAAASSLDWRPLPDLPAPPGVAGAFVGAHRGALLVAGGSNFAPPNRETQKTWHDRVHVLVKTADGPAWRSAPPLPHPWAHGAAVSTADGVLCIGGHDGARTRTDVRLLRWDPAAATVEAVDYPPLPRPCAHGQAALVGEVVYLAGGQAGDGLETALRTLWALDLSKRGDPAAFAWRELEPWPGGPRAFPVAAAQHNGYDDCLYVLSGRRLEDGRTRFLTDVWEYTPRTGAWRRRADAPRPVMAGGAAAVGQAHLFVFGGDDGAHFHDAAALGDRHPGFPREALSYHTITDTWTSAGPLPAGTAASGVAAWDGRTVLAGGELRPRARTTAVWSAAPLPRPGGFGTADYVALAGYLLAMVLVGVWFARRNRSTDDFFRGGKQIPWWAVGCSLFATMLSSLTYLGLPSKAFAQDWVYAVGNLMVAAAAFVAVAVAVPLYRRADVTSAYEYLERRFSRGVRLFGSASFALFHVFRMGIVLSLTGLALAVATPLTPAQAVVIMGGLSVLYCAMGGIAAVVWTDTLQTVVLLGGALAALVLLVAGAEGGWSGTVSTALDAGKLRLANLHGDPTSARLALWVVVIGAAGQNLASYTADQAVVQRYMTTPTARLAARAVWTNALLAIPATVLFFGIGTALFAYYRSHPERLDPTVGADQIFPLFIAREMPAGLAGLIVAGIFAAAQSTLSSSMNSSAASLVTDFLRPFGACRSERGYLAAARALTAAVGLAGTGIGLVFVDPGIRSLFDAFVKVLGLFMGVLGGLFLLGALTRRANAFGALAGAVAGAALMLVLWRFTAVNGFLYTAAGLTGCFVAGYLASLLRGAPERDLAGLTVFARDAGR